MDENENVEYNPLDMGSTEYWQNEWQKEKEEKEELEKKQNEEVDLYFKCNNPKCGYVVKTKEKVKLKDVEDIIQKYQKGKCPKCGHTGFKQIDKKTYDKLKVEFAKKEKKKKAEEEIDVKKLERGIKENIVDDVEDLLEDLTYKLLSGKMSPKSFVNIFYRLAMNITSKYYKDLPGGADVSTYSYFRKSFLSLCDKALGRYNVQENAEYILESYDIEIEQNKDYLNELYDAEYGYYINDDKYSVLDFEMKERISEYENVKNNIFKEEANREREKEYQERKQLIEEKYAKRMEKRELRSMLE